MRKNQYKLGAKEETTRYYLDIIHLILSSYGLDRIPWVIAKQFSL